MTTGDRRADAWLAGLRDGLGLAPTDARLDLEFTNHPVELPTCRDLYSIDMWCKRPPGHDGVHAAGFGEHRVRWTS